MSKRKLIVLIPILAIFLLAGTSVALAYTGHFKSLAKALHISADTTTAIPQNYTVCGTDPTYADFYGVYNISSNQPDSSPYWLVYQKDSHNIGRSNASGLMGWVLSSSNITFVGGQPNLAIPPEGSYAYNNVSLMVKIGVLDSSTCLPSNGAVHGYVKNSAGNMISGATVSMDYVLEQPSHQTTTDTTQPFNYSFSNVPVGIHSIIVTMNGYVSQTKPVTIVANQIKEVDFVLQTNATPPATSTFELRGQVVNSNNNPISGATITVYVNTATSGTDICGAGHESSSCIAKTGTSTGTFITSPAGKKYNYVVSGLPKQFISAKVSFSATNYTPVNDVVINSADINLDANENKYLAYKDETMVSSSPTPTPTSTIIKGKVTSANGQPLNQGVVQVGLKVGGYDRTVPFDQAFSKSDLTTSAQANGDYIFTISNSQFSSLSSASTIQVEICAQATYGGNVDHPKNPKIYFHGCYLASGDIGSSKLLTIEKGKTYSNINITIQVDDQQYKIKFLRADTGAPIDLTKQAITQNLLKCLDTNNNRVDCVDAQKLDPDDPSHSTFIYSINYNADTRDIVNFVFYFESTDYSTLIWLHLPLGKGTEVYLVPKNNKNGSYWCEQHGGMWFASYMAEKDKIFTPSRRIILDQMGALYVQLSYSANMQVPSFFIEDFRGGAYTSNPINAGCLTTKYIFALSTAYIDGQDVRNWVHELGHIIDFANGINSGQKVAFQANLDAGQNSNCNGKYGQQYPCFSNYAFQTNPQEMWAEFFTTWVTQMDKINAALADPNVSDACKNILRHLLGVMQNKLPNMPHYGLKTPTASNVVNSSGQVAGVATAQTLGFNLTALNSIMDKSGYQPVQAPVINLSISSSALLLLTPDQIIAGNWIKTNYQNLGTIQKVNFQLSVILNQVNNLFTQVRAISYVRTQLSNFNNQVQSWLSAIGFHFSTSSLQGRLTNQNGKPLVGIKITVGPQDINSGKSDITDANGQFSISGLTNGQNFIYITDPKNNGSFNLVNQSNTFNVAVNKNYTKYLMVY